MTFTQWHTRRSFVAFGGLSCATLRGRSPMERRRTALAQRRIAVGLTQEGLADELGMDVSAIKRWEKGSATPQPNVRRALAAALGISMGDLAVLLKGDFGAEAGIVKLSCQRDDRISDYKGCLLGATGEILVSGTSLLHITEDSLGLLAKKLETCTMRFVMMDPDWIERNAEVLTFLRIDGAKRRFRYEIDASIDRLRDLQSILSKGQRHSLRARAYSTIFPYILTGYLANDPGDSRIVVEITDYIPSEMRPRFTVVPSGSEQGLFEIVVAKFEELWNSPFVREVL